RERSVLADALAAAVVPLPRVALGVLVRRHGADGLEHRGPREVLRGDQLDLAALPLELSGEEAGDVGVDLVEARCDEVVKGLLRNGHDRLLSLGRGMVMAATAGSLRAPGVGVVESDRRYGWSCACPRS